MRRVTGLVIIVSFVIKSQRPWRIYKAVTSARVHSVKQDRIVHNLLKQNVIRLCFCSSLQTIERTALYSILSEQYFEVEKDKPVVTNHLYFL